MRIIFGKLKRFLLLDSAIILMLPEALFYIVLAHFKLRFVSFKNLSESMGVLMKKTPMEDIEEYQKKLAGISKVIDMVANNFLIKTTCYPRALCAKWMLNKRKMPSTLYLGVRKQQDKVSEGHAWVRCGSQIITGKIGHKTFTVIATYA